MDFQWKGHTVGMAGNGRATLWPAGSAQGGSTMEQDCATAPRSKGERIHTNLYISLKRGREEANMVLCKQSHEGHGRAVLPWVSIGEISCCGDPVAWVSFQHVSCGKSHWSCSARVPTAASWSLDLFDTRAEPEEILFSPTASRLHSRMPGGCSGHPWGFPRLAWGWDQSRLCSGCGLIRPASLRSASLRAHCLSCLLNTAF